MIENGTVLGLNSCHNSASRGVYIAEEHFSMLKMSESTETFVDIMSEQTAAAATREKIEFDEAFTLHHRTVFRAARLVVQDAWLAEDVTQETFLKLHKQLESINDAEMLRPWVISVAMHL